MSHLKETNHSYIRYANLWEDAFVLRKALSIQSGDNVLSIASAGDNCFAMLLDDPAHIVAVDINDAQIHLVEIKMTAISLLSYSEYLAFVGFNELESNDRIAVYNTLQTSLSLEAKAFWDQNLDVIKEGLIYCGKFEKYFNLFANKILPFIHERKTIEKLLAPGSDSEKIFFYERYWDTWRWRLFFKLFFSKAILGWMGRDNSFQKEIKINVSNFILSQAKKILMSSRSSQNYMLRYNLTGSFGHLRPDFLANESVYEIIKSRLERITLLKDYVQGAEKLGINFQAMNLSDIFEYMPPETFQETTYWLLKAGSKNCRYAYWNLMVDRRMSAIEPDKFLFDEELSNELHQIDRGFYYKAFILDIKR